MTVIYPLGKVGFESGSINLSSDTIMAALVSATYVYNAAHQYYSSVTGVVGTPVALASKTTNVPDNGVFDAADTVFTAVSGSAVTGVVIYKDTGSAATSPLIAYLALSVTPNGGDITAQWSSAATRIFAFLDNIQFVAMSGIASTTVLGTPTLGLATNDGYANAPTATIQYPTLLNGYAARPSWHVAGVDYAVGPPTSTSYTDWRTLSTAAVSVNTTTGMVSVYGSNVTLDSIDFSLGVGGWIYWGSGTNLTITNCKFNCSGSIYKNLSTGVVHTAAGCTGLTMKYNYVNGGSAGFGTAASQAALIYALGGGAVVLQYNHFTNWCQQVLEMNAGGSVDYRFNLCDNGAVESGGHNNVLQFSWAGTQNISACTFDYNTIRQTTASNGESPQFYINIGTGNLASPTCNNNTFVMGASAGQSYLIHGNTDSSTTTSGTPQAINNYFDITGCFGAWYESPMSLTGWTRTGNINMVTGSALDHN